MSLDTGIFDKMSYDKRVEYCYKQSCGTRTYDSKGKPVLLMSIRSYKELFEFEKEMNKKYKDGQS